MKDYRDKLLDEPLSKGVLVTQTQAASDKQYETVTE